MKFEGLTLLSLCGW